MDTTPDIVTQGHTRLVSFATRFRVRIFPGLRVIVAPPEGTQLRLVLQIPMLDNDAMLLSAEIAAVDLARCDEDDLLRMVREVLRDAVVEALSDGRTVNLLDAVTALH